MLFSHFNYRHVVLIGVAAAIAGCNAGPQPTYPGEPPVHSVAVNPASPTPASPPSQPPSNVVGNTNTVVTPPTVAPTPVSAKVPADAEDLIHPDYPPISFTIPAKPGTVLVVDQDGDPTTAVGSLPVSGNETNRTMSITDVPTMANSLNKMHKYRIVFVPAKSGQ